MTRLDQILDYPYRRVEPILGQTQSENPPLLMHIGEPKFGAPAFIAQAVQANAALFSKYPAVDSDPELRDALSDWYAARFGMSAHPLDAKTEIHPVCGSKEGLFQTTMAAVLRKEAQLDAGVKPIVLAPNPLYHPYFGSALGTQAEFVGLDLVAENGFLPDFSGLTDEQLARVAVAFVCTPGNPTGGVMSSADLAAALQLARKYDFILASDECYSEVYFDAAPAGLMDVCGDDRRNAVVLTSLSKRSAAPGLRSGAIAGDAGFIELLHMVRGYMGAQVPGPLAKAAAVCWRDETHVAGFRDTYRALREISDELLGDLPGYRRPQAGFFVWFDVRAVLPDEVDGLSPGAGFARLLWQQEAVKALPGEIMARPFGDGRPGTPGDPYIRLPLVYDETLTREAFTRVRAVYERVSK